jgi:hypothetical protein
MIKIVLVLLYIWKGQVVLEQKPMPDMDACLERGQARLEEIVNDPRFDSGLYADCLPLMVEEAKK